MSLSLSLSLYYIRMLLNLVLLYLLIILNPPSLIIPPLSKNTREGYMREGGGKEGERERGESEERERRKGERGGRTLLPWSERSLYLNVIVHDALRV